MKIISHRGNIRGPVPDKENRPSYIDCAIGNGYEVEVDLRCIDGELWLGHDNPQYKIDNAWMDKRKEYLWIHCKNLQAAKECQKNNYNSFCHSQDPFVYTSDGKIWIHNDHTNLTFFDDTIIVPVIDKNNVDNFLNNGPKGNNIPFAICTDYPALF